MKRIFIDTSAFYAVADKNDPAHRKSDHFLRANINPLVTTNLIFAETLSLITRRLGKKIAIRFGAGIWRSRLIELVFLSEEYQKLAWDLFCSHEDKEWDFIDSSCFVLMEKLNLMTAFALDKHFSQRGFTIVP